MGCVVLDTDLLIAFLRGDGRAAAFIEGLWSRGDEPTTTVINIYELYVGALRRGEKHVRAVRELEQLLPILPLDVKAARLAAETGVGLRSRGERIDIRDLLIASVAMVSGCSVATCNTRHFSRIETLAVEKWC